MKTRMFLFLIGLSYPFIINAQVRTLNEAAECATRWFEYISKEDKTGLGKKLQQKKIEEKTLLSDFDFYQINFTNGGYVIVAMDESINPIIAYSKTETFDENRLSEAESKWLECVDTHIKSVKEKRLNSKLKDFSKIEIQDVIDDLSLITNTNSSTPSLVLPLFETFHTSRWAWWNPYCRVCPDPSNPNICVPVAMAQIMKYYEFPTQGVGSYNGINYSKQWYDYKIMPFRLTYCGNNEVYGCNDPNFNIIPGITDEQIDAVSRLIYHCGVAVGMNWNTPGGSTPGAVSAWVDKMVQYFNYSSSYTYRNEAYIAQNKLAFKQSLRDELVNHRPVLFAFYHPTWNGHAVVIDGYENYEYFHFANGGGGANDKYYCLFDIDFDNIHSYPERTAYYRAAYGIQPNCSGIYNVNKSNESVSATQNIKIEATNNITLNNYVIEGNGSSGARVTIKAGSNIYLNPGFHIKAGAEAYILSKKCGPKF